MTLTDEVAAYAVREEARRRSRLRVLTAAGRQINLAVPAEVKPFLKRPLDWQRAAYAYYDPSGPNPLGEVWFATRFVAESLSRLRVFPAVQPDPEDDPISVTSDKLDEKFRPTDQEIEVLLAATRRLNNSHGGIADLLRGHGMNNFLAGESFLIGRTVDDQEEWEVHSVLALVPDPSDADKVALQLAPDAKPGDAVSLDKATVVRIWRRHPMWPNLPDAAMGAAIPYCDDLVIYRNMIRSAGQSRLASGILGIPDEASFEVAEEDEEAEGETALDPLTESLIKHFTTPIADPKDASAYVPLILRMAREDLEKVQKWDFARPIDQLAVDLRRECREAFAATVDLPADVMTGKQGLNDWSAWNVDEQTFRVHLAPHAELIMTGWTSGYLWPTLTGIDNPRRFLFWYDPDELVTHPNKAENAERGHKAVVISDSTFREALGFDDADAPDDAEVARRIEIARAVREPSGSPIPAGGVENGAPTPVGPASEVAAPTSSVVGAGRRVGREALGARLARIERNLMSRLLHAADAELRHALERAGNRIATAARPRHRPEEIRRLCASSPAALVASRLGPSLVAALGLTTEGLLDSAFETLESRWDSWVRQAQRQGLSAVVEEGEAISDEDEAAITAQQDRDRAAGWAVLSASLLAAATAQLYATEQPSGLGERDSSLLVTPGTLRSGLSVAGGGPVPGSVTDTATSGGGRGGLLSGQTIQEAFRAAAVAELGWVWVYGDPDTRTRPFEPHLELDGLEFGSWEDPDLAVAGEFPEVDFYFPGDHFGCQCTFARNGTSTVSGTTEEGSDGEA